MGEADVILGIRIKHEINRISVSQSYYIEKVLKKLNYFDYTPVSTPMDTSEKLMPNNGQAISQLKYSMMIGFLMYAMTCTRLDITFAIGKLSSGGAISWASKKQTCITRSTMESEFVALAAASKEAEWHNMIRELIMNRVVSIEFVRSQQNLANHLMKGLARDLVIKFVEEMGLKSNEVAEC
ncbi:hypothetical protein Tco_0349647 [Tanacetum coccineum]